MGTLLCSWAGNLQGEPAYFQDSITEFDVDRWESYCVGPIWKSSGILTKQENSGA